MTKSSLKKHYQNNENSNERLLIALGACGGGLFGYTGSILAGALLTMRFGGQTVTIAQQGILTATMLFGIAVGAAVSGLMTQKFGMHKLIAIGAITAFIGIAVCSIAPSLSIFIAARTILGLGLGFTSCLIPIYLGEMTPSSHRGRIVSVNSVMMVVGQLLAAIVNAWLSIVSNWHIMLASAAIPSILLIVFSCCLRETPSFLIGKGKQKQAHDALINIYPSDEADEIYKTLQTSLNSQRYTFDQPWLKRVLIVGIALAFMNQLTGQNMINYYAPTIFSQTLGLSASSSILTSVPVILVSALAAIFGGLGIVDRVDRRIMLIVGLLGTVVGMICIGFCYQFLYLSNLMAWLLIILMMVYLIFVQGMVAPITWLLIAEIFPSRVRAQGVGYANVAMNVMNCFISLIFPTVLSYFGGAVTFWIFAGINIFCLVFAIRFVPETRGKTLAQIEQAWITKSQQ